MLEDEHMPYVIGLYAQRRRVLFSDTFKSNIMAPKYRGNMSISTELLGSKDIQPYKGRKKIILHNRCKSSRQTCCVRINDNLNQQHIPATMPATHWPTRYLTAFRHADSSIQLSYSSVGLRLIVRQYMSRWSQISWITHST